MTQQNSTDQVLENLDFWLTNTGILRASRPERPEVADSFCGSYNVNDGRYDYVYHEITGYGLSLMRFLAKWKKATKYEQIADSVSRYLLDSLEEAAERYGIFAFPHSRSIEEYSIDRRFFSFDNGMIIQGLLDSYVFTKDERELAAAAKAGEWLLSMQCQDGSFKAYNDLKAATDLHPGSSFESDAGVLNVKLAIALIKLSRLTFDAKYEDAARRVLDWGAQLQRRDGAFWPNNHRTTVFSHAHCYACEGYLYAATKLNNQKYLEIAKQGITWLQKSQNRDGSLYSHYTQKNRYKATDATAQYIRLALYLNAIESNSVSLGSIERAVGFITTMQETKKEQSAAFGGIYYGRVGTLRRTKIGIQFTWCAMFATAALHQFSGEQEMNLDELF